MNFLNSKSKTDSNKIVRQMQLIFSWTECPVLPPENPPAVYMFIHLIYYYKCRFSLSFILCWRGNQDSKECVVVLLNIFLLPCKKSSHFYWAFCSDELRIRTEMNSYRFEISDRRENKFCLHDVSFRLHFKTTQYFDGYV